MEINDLKQHFNIYTAGAVNEIKLRDVLEVHREHFGLKQYKAAFPPVEIGSITLVDQIVLISFMDLLKPKELLEIGTYKAYTTRLLLDNSSPDTQIKTVDLPKQETESITADNIENALEDGDYNDNYLRREQQIEGEVYLKGISDDLEKRLELIKANSTSLDYKQIFNELDYAFIDGGHDYETVKADTENVLNAMTSGIILWHDFASNIHSDVTRYVNEIAKERSIFNVKGSLLAFSFV